MRCRAASSIVMTKGLTLPLRTNRLLAVWMSISGNTMMPANQNLKARLEWREAASLIVIENGIM